MPELPDITVYIEALQRRIIGAQLQGIERRSHFLLRTAEPRIVDANGKSVRELRRVGKRIAIGLEEDLWLVLHLMVAGRLQWLDTLGAKLPGGKNLLAAFYLSTGTLLLTEAGTKKRASLHLLKGDEALAAHDPAGLEIADATLEEFAMVLQKENHTLKRSLTDPHLYSGIGNAYSDEILHRAKLSPIKMSQSLREDKVKRLFGATKEVLAEWTNRLRAENGDGFPKQVTPFRDEMAVHGKFGKACPVCATVVQRIRYAFNETNYCPRCQTEGKVLADRSLSRLLKKDWPRAIEELEQRRPVG